MQFEMKTHNWDDCFLTIIVPVYKTKESFLRKCIESLIDQNRTDYNILLVDDGSPDICGAICDEYAEKNKFVNTIHQKNAGVSAARNTGIYHVKTQWVSFVDADDWVDKNYVSAIYEAVNTNVSSIDIIMYDYHREFKQSSLRESFLPNNGLVEGEDLNNCKKAPFYKLFTNGKFNPYSVVNLWNKAYRVDFLKRNDILFLCEARKGQDVLFNADAFNYTNRVYYLRKSLYHYRCWSDSRTNKYEPDILNLTLIELENLLLIIEKHDIALLVEKYMMCRICTKLYTCMRIYIYHKNNKISYKKQIEMAKKTVNSYPYSDAIRTVDLNLLSLKERVFIQCLKYNLYSFCYFLVWLKSSVFGLKLN